MIDGFRRDRPAFLASVTSAVEAEQALRGGADIIDCKSPAAGALGALPLEIVRAIVGRVARRAPVSATIGDLTGAPHVIARAAEAMAGTGVDYVKVGFFGAVDAREVIAALSDAKLPKTRLVAVLMADRDVDFSLMRGLAASGFAAVMLDTADKRTGSLAAILARHRLEAFVDTAAANGLRSGLAGSLQLGDVESLWHLAPDVLGFRGALCVASRSSALDERRVAAVRAEIDRVAMTAARSVA